jgi:hypothetical protein
MGSMTRLGQGLALENAGKGPSLRIARSGLHGFRVSCADMRKGASVTPIQVQVNKHGIGKIDLQWCTIRPRQALGCRASAADAGAGELPEEFGAPIKLQKDDTVKERSKEGMKGMAEAFDISPRTAFGITAVIAVSALVVPLYMPSSGLGMALKTRGLSYLTLLLGFYMAWNIGANDVANAMGTSVGSGALTLRQAVLTAAILEFSGAFMVGSHVSHTMQSGILSANVFAGKETLLFCGMLSSLGAAGTWLQVSAYS